MRVGQIMVRDDEILLIGPSDALRNPGANLEATVDTDDQTSNRLEPDPVELDPPSAGTLYATTISTMFTELTGAPDVGADENFFEVGGNSLAAVKLTSAISETFGVPMKLRVVLREPTVAALAREVAGLVRDRDGS